MKLFNAKKKIVIIYENVNREYDNCILLKAELERRGYEVVLKYKTESMCLIKDAALVITPNCYTKENEKFYRYVFAGNKIPILSLQCEQVFTKEIENKCLCYPNNELSNVYFSAWGENYYSELIKRGIDKNKVRINGAIQLDFCRREFEGFYYDRHSIANKYKLNEDNKWVLFISSLVYFPESPYYKHFEKDFSDIEYFKKRSLLEVNTQKVILEWFTKFVSENKDYIIIYRKHPVEETTELLKKCLQMYPNNFVEITDLSVKQWITVCDYCSNWFSTSSIEAAEFNKPVIILRPFPIESGFDYDFFCNIDKCKTYEDFYTALTKGDTNNRIERETYSNHYYFSDKPAFLNICDYVDEIINHNYNKNYKFEKNFIVKMLEFYIKDLFVVKLLIKNIYKFLYKNFGLAVKNNKLRSKYCFSQLEYSVKFHTDKDNIKKINYIKDDII